MFYILFVIYGIACTIAFVTGVGPTPGNPREWHWWERILTFPTWLLSLIAQKIPFLSTPIFIWMSIYVMICYPLSCLHEHYELWKYNRKNKK